MGYLIDLVPLNYTESIVVVGAAILGLCAGVLGAFAVLRQRSLVADAVAHATLPGVAAGFLLTGVKDPLALLGGAAAAGVIGALAMVAIERTSRIRADAAIGVVLSGFFALGIVALTYIAGTNNANQAGLDDFLFGQAAGLRIDDLELMFVASAAGLLVVPITLRMLRATLFDPAYAGSIGLPVRALEALMTTLLVIAVVVGLRAVGAILMVAMIVVPSIVARQFVARLAPMLWLAGAVGAAVGVIGALVAARTSQPTGPVIVLAGFAIAILAIAVAPDRGILWQARRRLRDRRRARNEAVLVDLETAVHAGAPLTQSELVASTGRRPRLLRAALSDLDRAGMIECHDGRLHLSDAGAGAAHAVLERRELWGLWLEHGWQLNLPDAREPNPADLTASLGAEHVDRLRELAGSRA